MFAPANQPRFTLTVDGDQHDLKVLEFTGKEAISQPYRFDLELVSERPDIDLESLLHRQAFLSFDAQGAGIHGQIYRVGQGDSGKRLTRYQVSLVPQLAYLSHRINQRIFQRKSVPEIIETVLKNHGIFNETGFKFQLGSDYAQREYCVQYAESDLAFIQRLCAEIGIHYHFQHSPDGHLLMFGDDQTFFPKTPETPYFPGSGMAADAPAIKCFSLRMETRTNAVTRRDYDFNKPRLQLESRIDSEQHPVLEDYRFPGQFSNREYGEQLAQRTLERHNADHRQAKGHSDQSAFVSGGLFLLSKHPRSQWNAQWLLTEIEHRGRQPQVLEESAPNDGPDDFQGYRNTFLATPSDVLFRPSLGPDKPSVPGYQSAVVTGPADSEIHCDEYGRVKVQLAWDRDGERNEHSSCWLRVATGWAHDGYGIALIPRVGMEVLVGFIDGDVDKPLVMGCLPNGANSSPLNLPADKTRSIFRSRSSPGGSGYNELRIEDRKGAEEIYLRAQRNWNQHVLSDMHVQVGNQRSAVVSANDNLHVHGDRFIRVASQTLNASGQFHVNAGQQVVIDGGASATIQAGGHWITIGPAGIFSSVPIELGGALMPTIGASTTQQKLSALSVAQILSLKSDAPFCEECERCKGGVCAA
ncbi:type VI secretion system tip protein VgrG [Pseudomonas sp. PB120]|uniref:type VI secretion system Vgr family protein n=1 Tax=Pseudomonas sp. PB120 TaxID=2494700 RepID=UPI0012FD381E|nr:type VI secretion system tip protein VgrG [Pseudomonas sp. PB120]MVV50333.1 type VI secretion system tip protein VgrG [Pseudomonas sp. PB120]